MISQTPLSDVLLNKYILYFLDPLQSRSADDYDGNGDGNWLGRGKSICILVPFIHKIK